MVLGFDVEWHVPFKRGQATGNIALIQLYCPGTNTSAQTAGSATSTSTTSRSLSDMKQVAGKQQQPTTGAGVPVARSQGYSGATCWLFHVHHFASALPSELKEVLTSNEILKVGLGIDGDSSKVRSDLGIRMAGTVELASLAKAVLPVDVRWSLASLTEELMCVSLPKDKTVRLSNWENPVLSGFQKQYAAADALASFGCYEQLIGALDDTCPVGKRRKCAKRRDCHARAQALGLASDGRALLNGEALQVYRDWHVSGLAMGRIAEERQLSLDTVRTHIAQAVRVGLPCVWARLNVPSPALAAVSRVLNAKQHHTSQQQQQQRVEATRISENTTIPTPPGGRILNSSISVGDGGVVTNPEQFPAMPATELDIVQAQLPETMPRWQIDFALAYLHAEFAVASDIDWSID
jgi:hypothetical protein